MASHIIHTLILPHHFMFQLAAFANSEIEIKKSRFLGQLYPINNRAEARSKLTEIRALHPNAVHVCWVLLCDGDSGLDDDGEPSGTAAKPERGTSHPSAASLNPSPFSMLLR